MSGIKILALLFAVVIGMLGFTQIVNLQASISATGGLASLLADLPTIYFIMFVLALVVTGMVAAMNTLTRR